MNRRVTHSVDLLFTVSLFSVFALCAVALILTGAQVYRSSAQGLEQEFSTRTALAYVQEKIQASDRPGGVTLTQEDGIPTLKVTTLADDQTFVTYIYYEDGWLKELFLPEDRAFSAHAGQKLLALSAFSVSQPASNLLEVTCSGEDGIATSLRISLRTQEGGDTP